MAITVESVSTGVSPITKPTGLAVGDLMVAVVAKNRENNNYAPSTPTGWTSIASYYTYGTLGILIKEADEDDVSASNFSFKDTANNDLTGVIYRISDYVSNEIIAFEKFSGADTGGDATGTVATDITPSYNDSLFIGGYNVYDGAGTGTCSTYGLGGSPTFTERFDNTLGGNSNIAVADAILSDKTALGNAIVVVTDATNNAITIAGIVIYEKVDVEYTQDARIELAQPVLYPPVQPLLKYPDFNTFPEKPTVYTPIVTIQDKKVTNVTKNDATNIINVSKS